MKDKMKRGWAWVLADRKRVAMLGLVTLMMLMWGRLLLKQVPQTTVADDALVAVQPGPRQAAEPVVEIDLSEELSSDLFGFSANRYRRTADNENEGGESQFDATNPDEAERMESARQDAEQLRLQSIVSGPPPMVMIDGHVLREGDTIEGFTVTSIDAETWSVVLSRDGYLIRVRR